MRPALSESSLGFISCAHVLSCKDDEDAVHCVQNTDSRSKELKTVLGLISMATKKEVTQDILDELLEKTKPVTEWLQKNRKIAILHLNNQVPEHLRKKAKKS